METPRPWDAVIIGAGIGGLSAGILLSRLGLRVAIVEKNQLPGGLMRGYRRGGQDCPVGVHYVGAFGEGEPLRRICDLLGVTEGMALREMGRGGPIDRYLFDDFSFDLPTGIDAFAAALRQACPGDATAIAIIEGNLRALAVLQNGFAFLAPAPPLLDQSFFTALGAYLAKLGCSPRLKSVLGVAARWMGLTEGDCPVFYHHLALASYLLSAWRPAKDGVEMAETFAARFTALGGELFCGDAVRDIRLAGGAVAGVTLASGRQLDAPSVVAAIHPKPLLAMLPEGTVKPRHVRHVAELAETEGLFSIVATLSTWSHPPLPYNVFRLHADGAGTIREGVFYQLRTGRAGKTLLTVITDSPYADWQPWEATTTGRRGADYEAQKARRAEGLLKGAARLFGPLNGVEVLDAYTPLSLRDWVNSPEGAPYGLQRSMRQLPLVSSLHRVAPPGLVFAGQNALAPGILGTLMGSLQAVRQMIPPERFAAEVYRPLLGL